MRRGGFLLLLAAAALGGCSGVQSALDPAADQAAHTLDIWRLMLWMCGVMYALVLAFLGWSLWRARRALAGPPLARGEDSPAERPMQRALAGWAGLIVLGLFVLAAGSFLVDRSLAMASTAQPVRIKVTGAQWWWKVEYMDPQAGDQLVTANELRLPVGRPAVVEVHSDDVIHSFWIPNLAGKIDLIPGRTNRLVITPRREGAFRGQCAEFCGLQHAQMALDATVMSPGAFEAWRQAQLKPATPAQTPEQSHGQQVFMDAACASCHTITGTDAAGTTGPDLTHLASRRTLAAGALPMDRASLIAWLHDTQTIKPGNHMPVVKLTSGDLDDLVAYLGALK
jgi:cytochrome c oxidase subunit 2